jgi:hypothetical protein
MQHTARLRRQGGSEAHQDVHHHAMSWQQLLVKAPLKVHD